MVCFCVYNPMPHSSAETYHQSQVLITVDVEDWPQSTFSHDLPITVRASDNVLRLLNILREEHIQSTMFVLGKFAEAYPDIVREIHKHGHEIASHGYGHVEIFKQTPEAFKADVSRSRDILESITGIPVKGYRAPDFSIVKNSLWALEILSELGFIYDSSIYPVQHPRYGIPAWPVAAARITLGNERSIIECPIASLRWMGKNWPVGGGGYHRLLPSFLIKKAAHRVITVSQFVYYCHPYEFDPREFKEINFKIPLSLRLHQGLGRKRFESRFRAFVRAFGGCRMIDWVSRHPEWASVSVSLFTL